MLYAVFGCHHEIDVEIMEFHAQERSVRDDPDAYLVDLLFRDLEESRFLDGSMSMGSDCAYSVTGAVSQIIDYSESK